ncbi:3-isopropylmalate/(R)-2-methylmalate dehydratase large subunit [Stella humosa]|uniref:3-isopropylmalate dehydratase n=1 Tax=Stella humosa TaxID=94 RepID=A0A3N1KV34_9PROT|nr:3-isopropylmalate dehydratase large subunit [Stella humosa]ROP83107.1 3-isopropylmalate/(R)-2-methylmalate dehydratase large subunit [Stella humosa]BBK30116.1 3-isopropylmalate dehydratase large subunit [Stella humosa]
MALTLFEKIWQAHLVAEEDGLGLLYIDRHFLQDGPRRKFEVLEEQGVGVRRPDRTFATVDHYPPTDGSPVEAMTHADRRRAIEDIGRDAARHGIPLYGLGDPRQGIVHVIGPEQGISLPGTTIVCNDSHTSTHGGVGAFAFGIGSTECGHVLATQTLWMRKPGTMRVTIEGTAADGIGADGIGAKDMALAVIARLGTAGAAGMVIEYAGSAVRALSVEGRLTLCNMSIEAGARSGMVAPDEATFAYLAGRAHAPTGAAWDAAVARWRTLASDDGAVFDREVRLDARSIEPVVTWGISPDQSLPIGGRVPDPATAPDAGRQAAWQRALDYMGLVPGTPLTGIAIDRVFIGSCTNGRIEDLRSAARIVAGRTIAVPGWVVPGSAQVKAQAEAEGLDAVFRQSGFDWRAPGCSMCVAQNGDVVPPGERCASTTNRNFIGRQGPGSRTHLMSPAMAAAAALTGRLTDVRTLAVGA